MAQVGCGMSPKIATLPPNEPAMWRKLLARVHPDAGEAGDHDLFIWASNVRETVCSNASEKSGTWTSPSYSQSTRAKPASSTVDDSDAVPFDVRWDHESLTEKAYSRADTEPEPYAHLLRLLRDCDYVFSGSAYKQQSKGATLK